MQPMKRLLFGALGVYDWMRFGVYNRLHYEGREHLANLPSKGVLFVSNHLTYYMDVLAIHHAIAGPRCSPLDGFRANLNVRFVAAVETLNNRGLIPKIFNYTGAVPIRRTWRAGDQDVKRSVDAGDLNRIGAALRRGWLITFPQGTTTPGAPVRKGTAHIIREHRPCVVPVSLDGFDQAFSKKGFRRIASGVDLAVRFSAPLVIHADDTIDHIVEMLTEATARRQTA
ncbi:MAG TPA: lysophospholipid acyltransferase family protein [Candidatus Binatia bacterium]|nr:lysophospholipid acyltransferase family protein [Candidatus Binatia bacterium]